MSFGPLFSRVGHYFWAMEFLFEGKDVFKCYSISHDEVDRLLSHQFHEFGFMGWARIDRGG